MKNLMNFFGDGNPHMEKFVPTEIGKYYHATAKDHNLDEGFYVVTGYDFFNDIYLSQKLEHTFWGHYIIAPSNVEFLTLQQAIEKTASIINNKNGMLNHCNNSPILKYKRFNRTNYINEFMGLFQSYESTQEQLKAIQNILIKKDKLSDKLRILYTSEEKKALRGLRKMQKRFHFFYQEWADDVIYLADNHVYIHNIKDNIRMLKSDIRKYEHVYEVLMEKQNKEMLVNGS